MARHGARRPPRSRPPRSPPPRRSACARRRCWRSPGRSACPWRWQAASESAAACRSRAALLSLPWRASVPRTHTKRRVAPCIAPSVKPRVLPGCIHRLQHPTHFQRTNAYYQPTHSPQLWRRPAGWALLPPFLPPPHAPFPSLTPTIISNLSQSSSPPRLPPSSRIASPTPRAPFPPPILIPPIIQPVWIISTTPCHPSHASPPPPPPHASVPSPVFATLTAPMPLLPSVPWIQHPLFFLPSLCLRRGLFDPLHLV